MKSRIFVLSIFISLFGRMGVLLAQDSMPAPKRVEQSVEVTGGGYINSTTINNNFIRAFYYGQYIDDVLKEGAAEKIAGRNLLGGSAKAGVAYTYHSLAPGNNPVFSFSFFDRTNLDLRFSKDLFNTIFYGNKMYAGETAQMGEFSLNFLRYQQFRFGWDWKGDAWHGSYGFAFSVLSGEQNVYARAPVADLYTAPDGTFLDFNVQMRVQQTDTAHKSYFAQNGMGLSTDFYYTLPYIVWKKSGTITFDVKDLGFIRWNSNSMNYEAKGNYHYDGIDVQNLFNLDSTVSPLNIDSVINKHSSFIRKQYNTAIPTIFDIHTKTNYGKQIAFEKGIVWRFNTMAKPYYYAKLHFLFGRAKTTDIAYVIGYGGYGRFTSGADVSFDFAKHYTLHFADNYLFSGITAQSTTGMGLYLRLVRRF